MLGILFGTLCLIGLVAVVSHGRRWHGYGCASHGCVHGGCGGIHRGGWGPRSALRSLFARLGTSPSQEKVIVAAANDLRDQAGGLWSEMLQSKADLAQAMRGEPFDTARLEAAAARQDAKLAEVRKAMVDALAKVHEVLDADQRRALAQVIDNPRRFHGGCGC